MTIAKLRKLWEQENKRFEEFEVQKPGTPDFYLQLGRVSMAHEMYEQAIERRQQRYAQRQRQVQS